MVTEIILNFLIFVFAFIFSIASIVGVAFFVLWLMDIVENAYYKIRYKK